MTESFATAISVGPSNTSELETVIIEKATSTIQQYTGSGWNADAQTAKRLSVGPTYTYIIN